nr:amino acid ABC transporter permease [Afipia sp.]
MATEPRKPPLQLVARLRRVLGGQAGWGGVIVQILFVAAVVWIGYEIVENARANLQAQRIASGFGFLSNTAGFAVSQALIPYSETDTYARAVFV